MYIPIEPSESIEAFMTHGKNNIIESFIQHLFSDSWIQYFWTDYFQVGTWINFQLIVVVSPCCAYPKIFTPWINVETSMTDLAISCGYCVSCYRFEDGGWMSAIFKLGHKSINWISPWGIENWSKIFNFKSPLPHINGVKCTWCVKKNWLWFEIIAI